MTVDFVHPDLGREVHAIGGHYTLTKEVRLPFRGREVLYLGGQAVVDNSCCSVGGFCYVLVPGFIVHWQSRRSEDGLAVSEVEPIRDEETQRELRRMIEKDELVNQVQFQ